MDVRTEALRVKAAKPEAIFVSSYQAYDAMQLLAQAIAEKGADAMGIKEWLAAFPRYDGLAGPYVRRRGVLEFSPVFYRVHGDDYSAE